jgi:hypothetical protein
MQRDTLADRAAGWLHALGAFGIPHLIPSPGLAQHLPSAMPSASTAPQVPASNFNLCHEFCHEFLISREIRGNFLIFFHGMIRYGSVAG